VEDKPYWLAAGALLVLKTGWQREISFARAVQRSVTSTEKNFSLTGPQSD
jgi:hypothetical protein